MRLMAHHRRTLNYICAYKAEDKSNWLFICLFGENEIEWRSQKGVPCSSRKILNFCNILYHDKRAHNNTDYN